MTMPSRWYDEENLCVEKIAFILWLAVGFISSILLAFGVI